MKTLDKVRKVEVRTSKDPEVWTPVHLEQIEVGDIFRFRDEKGNLLEQLGTTKFIVMSEPSFAADPAPDE